MKKCEECVYEMVAENTAIVIFECIVCGNEKIELQD